MGREQGGGGHAVKVFDIVPLSVVSGIASGVVESVLL